MSKLSYVMIAICGANCVASSANSLALLRGAPSSCRDDDEIREAYFGIRPEEQFGPYSVYSDIYAYELCLGREVPLVGVEEPVFIRCTWVSQVDRTRIVSLMAGPTGCAIRHRTLVASDVGLEGVGYIESVKQVEESDCFGYVTSLEDKFLSVPPSTAVSPGGVWVDGESLLWELKDHQRFRAGMVGLPIWDPATGPVAACAELFRRGGAPSIAPAR